MKMEVCRLPRAGHTPYWHPAGEMLVTLTVAFSFLAPKNTIWNATWMLWVIALSLIYVPFLYNPNALQLAQIGADLRQWRAWASRDGLDGSSWKAWWDRATPPPAAYGCMAICGKAVMSAICESAQSHLEVEPRHRPRDV